MESFVVAVSTISSLIAILIGFFSLYISPKHVLKSSQVADDIEKKSAHDDAVAHMLFALKNGEKVSISIEHIEPAKTKPLTYKYNDIINKESGRPLPSST